MTSKMRSRKDLKEQLLKRGQESHERKDDSGRFGTIFRKDLSGIKFWKCGEGEHQIDIIPWFAGKNYPTKNYPNLNAGDPVYVLDIWVHYRIGADEDAIVCPSKNYNEPCPVCEHINELRKEEDVDEELIKSIIAKRRAIYNILCYDSAAEEEKGVQVWDVAHFLMEKHLAELSKKPRGGGFVTFADPDEGKTIFFKRKGTTLTTTEYVAHQFIDREKGYEISDEDLEAAEKQCLDEMLIILSYEDIRTKHWGSSGSQTNTPKEEPTQGRKRRRRPEPEKESEEEPQEEPEPQGEPQEESTGADNPVCPGGGQFGVNIDELGEKCDLCEIWDDCAAEANRLEKEAKEKKQPESNTGRRRRRPV